MVSLTGSANEITKNCIPSNSFLATFISSGDMKLEVELNDIEVNLSGSTDIQLTGTNQNLTSNLNGYCEIEVANFKTKNANATVSGSGDTNVYYRKSFYAKVSGSGTVKYK